MGQGGNRPTTLPADANSTVDQGGADAVVAASECQPAHQPSVTAARTAADASRTSLTVLVIGRVCSHASALHTRPYCT